MLYAINKDADQPAHLQVFVVCCLESIIPILTVSKISRLQLVSVVEQTGLCHTWLQNPEDRFFCFCDMAQCEQQRLRRASMRICVVSL